jgi:palmitoyltransferase
LIRTKHCKDCGRCVSTHDHHCPWLGNCIGEKNRCFFYWYVVFQALELWWAMIWVFESYNMNSLGVLIFGWFLNSMLKMIGCIVLGFFTLLVTVLLIFHTYLAVNNQTTWESVSWGKISYLKKWPRRYKSPFSAGALSNMHYFCISS